MLRSVTVPRKAWIQNGRSGMTEEEWGDCFVEANRLELSGWELLEDMELCMEVCNGIGAEWMPGWIRKFLGWLFPVFAPAVAIHDLRYEIGEGPRDKWDDELEENCRKLARDKYGVFNPLRGLCYVAARRMRIALAIGGMFAYGRNDS